MYARSESVQDEPVIRSYARSILAALWVSVGCSAPSEFVPLPDDDADTIVLASRARGDMAWSLWLRTPAEARWTPRRAVEDAPPTDRLGEDRESLLLLYDESPDSLGLHEAWEASCRVLSPRARFVLVRSDESWSWEAVQSLPDRLGDALVGDGARCDPCAPMKLTGLRADSTMRMTGAAWFEDGSALALNQDGLWRVTMDGITPLPSCEELSEPPYTAAAAGGGRFWLGGDAGELALVRLSEAGCSVETSTRVATVPDVPHRYTRFEVVAPRPGDEATLDLLALRATGELFRWSSSGLHRLAILDPHPSGPDETYSALRRLDATRAAASFGWDRVYRFDGDALVETEPLVLTPPPVTSRPRDRITSLDLDLHAQQLIAGTAYGELFVRPLGESRWRSLAASTVLDEIGAVRRGRARYLVIHAGGDLSFLHDETGLCQSPLRIPVSSRSAPHRVVLEREGAWLIADANGFDVRPAAVSWLEELPITPAQ